MLLVAVGVLLLLGVLLIFVADQLLRGAYEAKLQAFAAETESSVDRFCEVQQQLSADPFFHQQRTEGDAGPLLNRWLGWDADVPAGSPLVLPPGLKDSPVDDATWLTSPPDVSALDFGWMEQLHAYDRWDLSTETAFTENLSWEEFRNPSFRTLLTWARLRLVKAMKTGELPAAARDVRQLAWLTYQTELGMGGAFAARMLALEGEAYRATKTPPPEWSPMPEEQLARLQAVTRLAWAYSSVAAPADVGAKARTCGSPAVTRCIGVSEGAATLRLFAALDAASLKAHEDAVRSELQQGGCLTSAPKVIFEKHKPLSATAVAARIPSVRWLGMLPHSIGGPRIAGVLLTNLLPSPGFASELKVGAAKP